jgi:division protein CdvB (Snf7/Vps24/ESCRT-III family)
MPDIATVLHDEIDELESLREEAKKIVEKVRVDLTNSLQHVDHLSTLFDDATVLVGNALADITTNAVQKFGAFAKEREAATTVE